MSAGLVGIIRNGSMNAPSGNPVTNIVYLEFYNTFTVWGTPNPPKRKVRRAEACERPGAGRAYAPVPASEKRRCRRPVYTSRGVI